MTLHSTQVLEIESARVKALVEKDIETLERVLHEKLTYIHSNGHVDNKTQVIDKMKGNFRYAGITRGNLNVEIYDDVAVMTGPMHVQFISANDDKVQEMSAMVTQVWKQEASGLQLVAYQVAKTA